MSERLIVDAVKTRLKTIVGLVDRVSIHSSEFSFLWHMKGRQAPGIGIVYTGTGDDRSLKGTNSGVEAHSFEIIILQRIWKEDEVVTGGSNQKGLLELRDECIVKLKGHKFKTELPTCEIHLVVISDKSGTKDQPDLGNGFTASVSFKVTYKEYI